MKKVSLLILLFVCSLTLEMFATVLVIDGCTKPHFYRYVRHRDGSVICEGNGRISCMQGNEVMYSPTHKEYNLVTVYEFVVSKIISGESTGSVNYQDDLLLKWKNENDVLTLEIGDVSNGNFRNYEKTDE
jgi:hypothetical protein